MSCRATVLAVVLAFAHVPAASAFTTHLFEDFDDLPLGPSIDEAPFPNAFTHTEPAGWFRDASGVPGVGNPDIGTFEWEGWSFANKAFWETVGARGRDQFTLGKNTIAVADTDAWNDKGNPANTIGFYNTFLTTHLVDFSRADKGGLKLAFESSWLPECCDDGERFDPNNNNQTALIRLVYPDGTKEDILHWESAPYIDSSGGPSENPADDPNPFYKPDAINERILIDLESYLDNAGFEAARFEFAVTKAGDDGWWAIDAVHAFSLSLIPGDMNVDGLVDEQDVSAFALGVRNPIAYSNTYFGEFPVTRGSPDGTFDFDDIPWFVDLLDASGVALAAQAVQAAIAGIPEPSTFALSMAVFSGLSGVRHRRQFTRANR